MTGTVEQQNKTLVRDFIAALSRNDVALIDQMLADDFVWENPQNPKYSPLSGRKDKAHFMDLQKGLASQTRGGTKLVIHGMTAEGSRVAVEAESFAETPVGPYNNRYHFLFEIADGKLVLGREYADSAYMQAFAALTKQAAS